MKRKSDGAKDDREIAKRLKILTKVFDATDEARTGYLEKLVDAHKHHDEEISRLKRETKAAEARFESDLKQAHDYKVKDRHRGEDANEACGILEFYRDKAAKNLKTVYVCFAANLFDHTAYGSEVRKVINEVFGGVIPLRGYIPVERCCDEVESGDEEDGLPVVSQEALDRHVMWEGAFKCGIAILEKDEMKGLTDWSSDGPFCRLDEDICDEKEFQDIATTAIEEDGVPHEKRNVYTAWVPVELFGLTAGPSPLKTKLVLPKSGSTLFGLMKEYAMA